MRPLRLARVVLLGLSLGTICFIYLFMVSELGVTTFFPLLKNAPVHSGVRMLQARWKDLTGKMNRQCEPNYSPNASKLNWTSYPLDSQRLLQIAKSLKLNFKNSWISQSLSLFTQEDFENVEFPVFKARIPAMVYYKNTFLVFCEARFDGVGDSGNMVISLRRGVRRGREVAWERIRLIASVPEYRTMNPSPIVDRQNDAIVVVFSAFPTYLNFRDMLMYAGYPLSRVYVMKSYDVGFTWTNPVEITRSTIGQMDPFPVLYVPGPGHSIQMKCGRLVVPGNFYTLDKTGKGILNVCSNCTNLSNIIYSNDGGTTWHLGGETAPTKDASGSPVHPNEVQIAELEDGTLYMTSRTLNPIQPRSYCYSHDGGRTLSAPRLHAALFEPGFKKKKGVWKPMTSGGCQASVISVDVGGSAAVPTPHRTWLFFTNPADPVDRVNLGLRLSVDGGQSWSKPWILFPYKSGYSDLVYFETRNAGKLERYFAVLFEGGSSNVYDHIKFQMFNLEAVVENILNQEKMQDS